MKNKALLIAIATLVITINCMAQADRTPEKVMDIDGNVYHTITIGTQTWIVENLKTTHYRDGSLIANETDDTAWEALSTGAWCNYDNLAANDTKYGKLYNWYAVNTGLLAPLGWHVPTDVEWTTLTDYISANLGISLNVAKAIAATTDWTTDVTTGTIGCNLTLNNATSFSALPGGGRGNSIGAFYSLGVGGFWWSATGGDPSRAWNRFLYYASGDSFVYRHYRYKSDGFSVRCVRD